MQLLVELDVSILLRSLSSTVRTKAFFQFEQRGMVILKKVNATSSL